MAPRTRSDIGEDKSGHRSVPRKAIAARLLMPCLGYLRASGVDVAALLGHAGIDLATLFASDDWINDRSLAALWREAERAVGPDLPFRAVRSLDFKMLGLAQHDFVLARLFAASATLGEGLAQYARMQPVTQRVLSVRLEIEGDRALVRAEPVRPEALPSCFVEYVLALLARLATALAATPPNPFALQFAHARPRGLADPLLPDCDVRFDAPFDALVIPRAALDTPMSHADPVIAARTLETIRELLARHERPLAEQVREFVAREIASGRATAVHAAKSVGLSVRQFSRRLEDEGTSHRAIVDDVRAVLARRYLDEKKLSVDEIAERLGYSDASALRRAQRRWNRSS